MPEEEVVNEEVFDVEGMLDTMNTGTEFELDLEPAPPEPDQPIESPAVEEVPPEETLEEKEGESVPVETEPEPIPEVEVVEVVEAKEAEVEEEVPEEIDPKDARISALEGQLIELAGQVTLPEAAPKQVEEPEPVVEKIVEQATTVPPSQEPIRLADMIPFVSRDEHADILRTPEGMNNAFTKVFNTAYAAALQAMTPIVQKQVSYQVNLQGGIREFLNNNKDIAQMKPYIDLVLKRSLGAHPEWNIEQHFDALGPAVRKSIGRGEPVATKPIPVKVEQKVKKANVARAPKGTRPVAINVSEVEGILEGMKNLDR